MLSSSLHQLIKERTQCKQVLNVKEVLLDTMQTRLLRKNYSIITSPWPSVVAGLAYHVIQRNDTAII